MFQTLQYNWKAVGTSVVAVIFRLRCFPIDRNWRSGPTRNPSFFWPVAVTRTVEPPRVTAKKLSMFYSLRSRGSCTAVSFTAGAADAVVLVVVAVTRKYLYLPSRPMARGDELGDDPAGQRLH